MKNKMKNRGFSLIEVMIALLVLALGILGISKLQGTLIRNSSDANQRTVAINLAQKKIDDLKSFAHLQADVNNDGTADSWVSATTWPLQQQSFAFIANNEGGKIAPGTVTLGNYTYNLTWAVTPYYFNSAASNPSSTAGATVLSTFKNVKVTVSWKDEVGKDADVVLTTNIDAYSAVNTGNSPTNVGSNSPIIPYTPKAAPDVIPVTLHSDDGLKKETDKPLPDVSKKGASTSVRFQTVTYNQALDTVKREDYKTLACLCTTGTSTTSILKGKTIWDTDNSKLADITESVNVSPPITKTSVDNSGGELQDADCFVCCKDGADVVLPSSNFKACRLKRIDGIYRIYEPWKMIAFNVIPASYFDANATLSASSASMTLDIANANIASYSDYVVARVRANAKLSSSQFASATVDTSFAPDNFQGIDGVLHRTTVQNATARPLQARAVYMDYPPTGIYTNCASCAEATIAGTPPEDVVPLDRISFNEVNATIVAGWVPDRNNLTSSLDYTLDHDNVSNSPGCNPASAPSPSRNYVTNDAIQNGCESSLSRGKFYPKIVTVLGPIKSLIYKSNDGLVDRKINTSVSSATATIDMVVK